MSPRKSALVLVKRRHMPLSELLLLLTLWCSLVLSSVHSLPAQIPALTFHDLFDRCPADDNRFQPCECRKESHEIKCGKGISDPNTIRYIFQEASPAQVDGASSSSSSRNKPYRYSHLIFENSPLDTLVSKSFEHFTFIAISVQHNYYLTTFEPDAFYPSNQATTTLKFDSNPKLGYINESVYSLFSAVRSFRQLDALFIHNCALTFIPPDAFGKPGSNTFPRLKRISLLRNAIKTIHGNAFVDMPRLAYITLGHNKIDRIEDGAIQLTRGQCDAKYTYEKPMYFIDLTNNQLTGKSLNGTSIRLNCASEVNLSNNSISYLAEPVFRPLFSQQVKIVLYGNPLECANCNMSWLLKGRFCPSFQSTIRYSSLVDVASSCDAMPLTLSTFLHKCAPFVTRLQKVTTYFPPNSSSSSDDALAAKYLETFPEDLIESDVDLLRCPSQGGMHASAAQSVVTTQLLLFPFVVLALFTTTKSFLFLFP